MTGGAVNIPLKDGKSIKVPVDRLTYDPETKEVNISDEMSKTAIWKQLVANESNPNIQDNPSKDGLRHRYVRRCITNVIFGNSAIDFEGKFLI